MIIYLEPIRGSRSFTRLQVVPKALCGIIFTAFNLNPLGGHFNAYRTLHRLRLCYFWPEMYGENILLTREMNVQERLLKKLRQRTHEGIT